MFVLTQNEAVMARLIDKVDAKLFRPADVPDGARAFAETMAAEDGSYMSLVALAYDTTLGGASVPFTGAWPVVVVPTTVRPRVVGDGGGSGVTVLSVAPLVVYATDPEQVLSFVSALMHIVPVTDSVAGSGLLAIMKLAEAAGAGASDNGAEDSNDA